MQASSVSDPFVARWIRRTLAADPPRAKSLTVTVWGDALAPHGGSVWLAGLIRLMAPFGINERLVRTSVFRLAAEGSFLRNAADTRDWNASPMQAGEKRGTSDRFVLKYVKP